MTPRTVVIGIGNPLRGDDAAGVEVVERLRGHVPDGVEVASCDEEPSRLIETWANADAAVIVDAVASGASPGLLHRFDAGETGIPAHALRSSTHAIGLAETIELARALGKLPPRVLVYGIEGSDFGTGRPLSPEVEAAVETVVTAIQGDLESMCTSAR